MDSTSWPLGPMCVQATHPERGTVYLVACDRDLMASDPKTACKWRADPIDAVFTTPNLAEKIAIKLVAIGIAARAIECSEID
jgi:hypothetical protein